MRKGTAGGLESLNFDLIQPINLQAALEANERKGTAGGLESLNFDLTQSINLQAALEANERKGTAEGLESPPQMMRRLRAGQSKL